MKVEQFLADEYLKLYPEEASKFLEKLPPGDCVAILEDMDPQTAAEVLRGMASWVVQYCIATMPSRQAANILSHFSMPVCALFLRRIDAEVRQKILVNMKRAESRKLEQLISFPETTAGGLMNVLAPTLPVDTTVNQALSHLRELKHRVYSYLYIVDRERRYAGYTAIWQLFHAERSDTLDSIMHNDRNPMSPNASQQSLLNHPGWSVSDELPVVDANGFFLGAIQHRSIRASTDLKGHADSSEPTLTAVLELGQLYATAMHGIVQSLTTPPDTENVSTQSTTGGNYG